MSSTDPASAPAPARLADLAGVRGRTLIHLLRTTTPMLTSGLALTLLLAFVAGAGRIVTPLTVQYALDHGLLHPHPGTADVVLRAVGVGAGATVLAAAASGWLNRRVFRRTEAALAQLRADGVARIHEISYERFARIPSADLVSRLTSDLDTVTTFVQNGGVLLLVNAAQMVIAAVLISIYSWQLALPVLAAAALLLVVMRRIQAVVGRRFRVVRERVSAMQSVIGEAITGIAVIRSTGTERRSRAAADESIEQVAAAQRHTLVPLHTNTALGEVAISFITTFIVIAGVRWSVDNTWWEPGLDLSAGELVALLLLVTFFVRPLQLLVTMLGEVQSAVAGWRRAIEVLATPSAVVAGPGARELPPGPIAVDLHGVAASYGDAAADVGDVATGDGLLALRDVTIGIDPGEHVAVVGETGSGKSTFARLLTRQLSARRGRVLLGGIPIAQVGDRSFQRRIAVVPQDPFLFDATIADNILAGVHGDIRAPEAREALDEIVDSLGLRPWIGTLPDGIDTRVGVRGARLSAGERQLVALARTALVDPDLLVLDEATSGVDPATDVRVQHALDALTVGRTTISIAHRMVTAERADRILVFDDGRIVQNGRHADLVTRPGRYADLHAVWVDHTVAADHVPHPREERTEGDGDEHREPATRHTLRNDRST
ncbi:putative ABC transport system ATP-binding protein [Parafrankia irregularis]|uniref:Putative ABC transport system ATP-binding protein n=1 Tax=Parafrankia irregularis TaxID=795642 RepID=A0A0S4QYA4_9ACTN|nr:MULTISPECIES: ABC transporter ATP-binding protein [Parafrankia]MBE3202531.1 ABC transporter ATP-binding protein [Parafrankia sp. CH37]CUU59542.1 putative ABC transport system ATP-binding protein [Parafrankia irregularis]